MTIKNAFPATRTGGTFRKISFSTTGRIQRFARDWEDCSHPKEDATGGQGEKTRTP
jgi:hypothetical protein